jgi:NTP pyrophosphatase (non-canonical NTP hydrolase)
MSFQNFTPEDLKLLNLVRNAVAKNAEAHGFREQYKSLMSPEQWEGTLGAVVRAAIYTSNQHSEASEFWEAFRAGKLNALCDKADKMTREGLPPLTNAEEEIADEIIRVLDKAEAHGVDVAKAVATKMAYNATRPHLHGGKLA